ncbi:hypothetical protein ACA910_004560 [Epithemia clementina (nom. ined.)]
MSSESNGAGVGKPTNPLVTVMLTDMYQITMAYAHWANKRHEDPAVFELFFRKNPFEGEYTIFAGLDECLKHLAHFKFAEDDVKYLQSVPNLKHCEKGFFEWLRKLDTKSVTVHAIKDGTVCFPRVPLLIIEAPLAVGQLLETTLLTLINYPSLVTTNAARMVRAAELSHLLSSLPGEPVCVEFGLRRAQGPDGGFSASKYTFMGGFVGTSNVQAGKLVGLNVSGTQAHAFVQAYTDLSEVKQLQVVSKKSGSILGINEGDSVRLLPQVKEYRQAMSETHDPAYARTHDGELAAFIAYAAAFPHNFLCLIDTYDTLQSGLLNFLLVALVLDDMGYQPTGIRLDSGDLADLSKKCVKMFSSVQRDFVKNLVVVASNDINEEKLHELGEQKHAINIFGIGTNLVTCQKQPALGCVYKLVQLKGQPRIKLSQDKGKVQIPHFKKAYRLYGKDGKPIVDLLVPGKDPIPHVGVGVICRNPFDDGDRMRVIPHRVEPLHHLVFKDKAVVPNVNRSLMEAKHAVAEAMGVFSSDHLRLNDPVPYKVCVSTNLYEYFHKLWQDTATMPEYS